MIELVQEPERLRTVCEGDPVGVQIQSEFELYGNDPRFRNLAWFQGESLALSLRDGTARVCGESGDPEELSSFLSALRPSVILAREELCAQLGLRAVERGEVLCRAGIRGENSLKPDFHTEARLLASIFRRCGLTFQTDAFLRDVTYCLRKGCGVSCTESLNGEIRAAALAWHITASEAVIGAVAVEESCRRQGLGRWLLAKMADELAPRNLYVFQEEGRNTKFYQSCGFRFHSRWMAGRPVL